MDHSALTDLVEHFDEPTRGTKLDCQRVICGNSEDAEEANDFMMMLGVHPKQLREEAALKKKVGKGKQQALRRHSWSTKGGGGKTRAR